MVPRTRAPREAIDAFLLRSIRPKSCVLDVGCGYGETALLIARRVPCTTVEAVDIDAASARRTNHRFRRVRGVRRIRCRRGGAEELPRMFGRGRFDCAVVRNAFHELWRPVEALRAVRAVLKPGGALLIAEFTPGEGERVDDCPRYSLKKIVELAERAGFRIRAAHTRCESNFVRATRR